MTMLDFKGLDEIESDDMARTKPDEALVAEHVKRLGKTGLDREHFDGAYKEMMADERLRAVEVVAIAHAYAKGRKPKSKADALTAIRKRFVELRQIETLSRNAEKARPW